MAITIKESTPESCSAFRPTQLRIILVLLVLYQLSQIISINPSGVTRGAGDALIVPVPSQKTDTPKVEDQPVTSNVSTTPELLRTSTDEIKISNPNATTTWSKVRDECFSLNSDKWISGSIHSNNAANLTPELLDTLIEGPRNFLNLPSLFDQTICNEDSPLRTFSPPDLLGSFSQAALTGDWYHRLLYLAMHWKFHKPALEEHKLRKSCAKNDEENLNAFMDHHNIQSMDFECSDAKFVVIPVGSIGFGAYLNTVATAAITLALRTNRIPIFSSKSFFPWQKRKGKIDAWELAPTHCERKDLQCYFLPMSPCTVTNEELH